MKRIRLTIEWDGACDEATWARILADDIEDIDSSGVTRVTSIELLTNYGTTPALTLAPKPKRQMWWRALPLIEPVRDPFWLFVVAAIVVLCAVAVRGSG